MISSTIKPNAKNHTEDESSDYYAYEDDDDYSTTDNATKSTVISVCQVHYIKRNTQVKQA